jgi:hypothetical protein
MDLYISADIRNQLWQMHHAATPARWAPREQGVITSLDRDIGRVARQEDAVLIAALRNALPALLQDSEKLGRIGQSCADIEVEAARRVAEVLEKGGSVQEITSVMMELLAAARRSDRQLAEAVNVLKDQGYFHGG